MKVTSHDDPAPARALRRAPPALATFLLLNLLFLLTFADRDGYEGDDLNSIVPMFHLPAAREGLLLIYRYAWQPLSYEAGSALYRLTRSPDAVFLLAPVAGAVALMLLLWQGWREAQGRRSLLPALAVLLAVPEYWFSGLYYNSSVLGLPFLAGAILLVRGKISMESMLAAGAMAGIATLMRLDFVLACPLLAAFAWSSGRRLPPIAALAAGVLLILAIGWLAGIVLPSAIIDTYRASSAEIAEKAAMPGWDMRTKLLVWTVTFTPIGLLILIAGGPLILWRSMRIDPGATWLCLIAAIPMLVPMKDLLSVKYALPLLAFAPLLLTQALVALDEALPWLRAGTATAIAFAGGIALALLSISLFGHAPFLKPGLMPARMIGTHDGQRSYGGYLWMMAALDGPASKSDPQREATMLTTRFLTGSGPDMVIVGGEDFFSPGGLGWRHLQLQLEKAGIHGKLAGPHRLLFTHNGRRLWLVDAGAPLPGGADIQTIDLTGKSPAQINPASGLDGSA